MKVNQISDQILYIENVFPAHQRIVEELNRTDRPKEVSKIIPNEWNKWVDGDPYIYEDENGNIQREFKEHEEEWAHAGGEKIINWDFEINQDNNIWPRIDVKSDYDDPHKKAESLIELIAPQYEAAINLWAERMGQAPLEWVSKNYTFRKYRVGAAMGSHIDKNEDDPNDTMDWTALIYLTDDYEGGELIFDDLGISFKPSAGSIVFFPCTFSHMVPNIVSGVKIFGFMYIHSGEKISTSIGEPFRPAIEARRKYVK